MLQLNVEYYDFLSFFLGKPLQPVHLYRKITRFLRKIFISAIYFANISLSGMLCSLMPGYFIPSALDVENIEVIPNSYSLHYSGVNTTRIDNTNP